MPRTALAAGDGATRDDHDALPVAHERGDLGDTGGESAAAQPTASIGHGARTELDDDRLHAAHCSKRAHRELELGLTDDHVVAWLCAGAAQRASLTPAFSITSWSSAPPRRCSRSALATSVRSAAPTTRYVSPSRSTLNCANTVLLWGATTTRGGDGTSAGTASAAAPAPLRAPPSASTRPAPLNRPTSPAAARQPAAGAPRRRRRQAHRHQSSSMRSILLTTTTAGRSARLGLEGDAAPRAPCRGRAPRPSGPGDRFDDVDEHRRALDVGEESVAEPDAVRWRLRRGRGCRRARRCGARRRGAYRDWARAS